MSDCAGMNGISAVDRKTGLDPYSKSRAIIRTLGSGFTLNWISREDCFAFKSVAYKTTVEIAEYYGGPREPIQPRPLRCAAHCGDDSRSFSTAWRNWAAAASTSSALVKRPKLKRSELCASSSGTPIARST